MFPNIFPCRIYLDYFSAQLSRSVRGPRFIFFGLIPYFLKGFSLKRIGVFGGTFDPPHVGHLVTAVNVLHELDLDQVLFVVANDPWQKAGLPVSPALDRLAMVEAAVAGVRGLAPSSIEIDRGGPSYTADTLAQLHLLNPDSDLYLIMGSDAVSLLPTWERSDALRDLATLVVVNRPGAPEAKVPNGWKVKQVEVPRLEVSSTDLRARLIDGRPLSWLITDPVIHVINERHLYAEGQ